MFSQIITKAVTKKDICSESDDGNPGAFNTFKLCGVKWGSLCVFLEMLKGFLPVLLAQLLWRPEHWLMAFVVAAPVLGHALGIFNRFRGGKCIAVSGGAFAGLVPFSYVVFIYIGLYLFFSLVVKIKPNILRSIIVFSLQLVGSVMMCILMKTPYIAIGSAAICVIALIKHLIPLKSEMAKYRAQKIAEKQKAAPSASEEASDVSDNTEA